MTTEIKKLVIELPAEDADLIEDVGRLRLGIQQGQPIDLADYMRWLLERDVGSAIQEIERRQRL